MKDILSSNKAVVFSSCRLIFVQCYMIKTFDPFGSSYLSQTHELFKMQQKNGSL